MKAFPISASENSHGWSASQEGMDLRDYFAAKAMQFEISAVYLSNDEWRDEFAKNCYLMADAMMKARKL